MTKCNPSPHFPQLSRRAFVLGGAALGAVSLARGASDAAPRGRNCIFITLTGGPSQLDTWDVKPEAPVEYRGPFGAISTKVPGIWISELFPRLAMLMDKVALIRTLGHDESSSHSWARRVIHARLPSSEPELEIATLETCSGCYDYGGSQFGSKCQRAVRLIERGARFVAVEMCDSVLRRPSWDIHGYAPYSDFDTFQSIVAPQFDQAFTALITELNDLGLLDATLVVATGEFGRTARINAFGGRDHDSRCYSALLAGGAVLGGSVVGQTDKHGSEAVARPVPSAEFSAAVERWLGGRWFGGERGIDPAPPPLDELF